MLWTVTFLVQSQETALSPLSKISVITCGPGSELYATFGHSAIRVEDPAIGLDVVYNYGTFDFTTPNFYMKFTKGRMDYMLSRQNFEYFLLEYDQEGRWVKEQVLNLGLDERNALNAFLEQNYLPRNRTYRYDPLYDNCATRIWDAFEQSLGPDLQFDPTFVSRPASLRDLTNGYLDINSWASLGINTAWGSVVDGQATPKQHLFLPDFILRQTDEATLHEKPLASPITEILPASISGKKEVLFFFSPLFVCLLLFSLVVFVTYRDVRRNRRSGWLDFLLLALPGLAGCLLTFLWFFTDHTATGYNYNLLWAFPFHLIIAFVVVRKSGPIWISKYMLFALALLVLNGLVWLFGIQSFSPLLPIIWSSLALRYLFLFWSFKKPKLA